MFTEVAKPVSLQNSIDGKTIGGLVFDVVLAAALVLLLVWVAPAVLSAADFDLIEQLYGIRIDGWLRGLLQVVPTVLALFCVATEFGKQVSKRLSKAGLCGSLQYDLSSEGLIKLSAIIVGIAFSVRFCLAFLPYGTEAVASGPDDTKLAFLLFLFCFGVGLWTVCNFSFEATSGMKNGLLHYVFVLASIAIVPAIAAVVVLGVSVVIAVIVCIIGFRFARIATRDI